MPFGLSRRKTKVVNVHVRLSYDEAKEIDAAAADRGLSFAAEVRYLLKRGLRDIRSAVQTSSSA